MSKKPSLDEMHSLYANVFLNGDGVEILKDLDSEFYDVVPYQPNENQNINDTIFFEGGRNVVAYIKWHLECYKNPSTAPKNHRDTGEGHYL